MEDKEYGTEELIGFADWHLAKNYEWCRDFVLVRGQGSRVYDTEGKEYIDMLSCYSALGVGHSHPEIIKAAHEQIDLFTTCPRKFLARETILFAKELAEVCGMDKVLPMNTGAEAVETAMKLARKWGYTQKNIPLDQANIIFCENNFHGRTIAVISASTTPQYKEFFGPLLPKIETVPFGNLKALEEKINRHTAAFIVEPIQAEGGIIIPPAGYMAYAKKICEKYNVLFIADEVQTGFGRTGYMFACELGKVKPDLYILGKALGGGFPISAVAGHKHIMDIFEPGDHGSTFGGNPFSSHMARVAMDVIKKENLPGRAAELGSYFIDRLSVLKKKCRIIKEVRGMGLLIGVELYRGGIKAQDITHELWRKGILCERARDFVVRFSPPLTITREELDLALKKIEVVFSRISQ